MMRSLTEEQKARRRLQAHYDTIVTQALGRVLDSHQDLSPPIVNHLFYGAIDIDPKHLVIWLAFADADALREAEGQGHCRQLRKAIKAALKAGGYPPDVLSKIHIGFVSEEEVEAAGGPWIYFR
jgi:hypothetical protein